MKEKRVFSPEETHDIILCVEFSWMLFKVSLKAFFRAMTRVSLDFVELNKTVWTTVFEAKSPKNPLKAALPWRFPPFANEKTDRFPLTGKILVADSTSGDSPWNGSRS